MSVLSNLLKEGTSVSTKWYADEDPVTGSAYDLLCGFHYRNVLPSYRGVSVDREK